jgi:antitoxin component YwqK of YwqJK toxin-antitoxin module
MATTTPDQTILSANSFVGSIGVNSHVGFSWGGYNNLSLMIDDLKYLGITRLREGLAASPDAQPVLDGLAAAGYRFDFVVPSSLPASGTDGLQQYLVSLEQFQTSHPGSIVALEGLNEANIQHFSYNGSSTIAAAAQFQSEFFAAINADADLASIPVYNLTLGHNNPGAYSELGDLSSSSDYANAHTYISTSSTPDTSLQNSVDIARASASGRPVVITETGYTTQSDAPYIGASETVQAKSILNTLVDAYRDGVSSTYLYELLDRDSSAGNTNPEANFGLFNADGTPKLAATAIHNLTTILADDGTGGRQPTGSLGYSLDNMPATGASMVLGKSNGAYELVIWAEPRIWDDATDTEIVNPAQNVTVHLGSVHQSIRVYDTLSGTTPIAVYTDVSQFNVPVSDHPMIIEIDGPDTVPPVADLPADISGTAAHIVAQLSDLNASDTLKTITLTDTHTLPVASEATMNYIMSHYGKTLAAIQGGYSFSVTISDDGWSETKVFDSSGALQATTDSAYNNGVITSKVTVNADHSTDSVTYKAGIIAQEVMVEADGSKNTTTFDAAGHLVSEVAKNSDGSSSTTLYAADVKTKMWVTNADGSHDTWAYNIKGRSYTTELQHADASGKVVEVTRSHADDSLAYTKVIKADGTKVTTTYDSTGHKTTAITVTSSGTTTEQYDTSGRLTKEIVQQADGSVTTMVYTATILTAHYIVNPDGSTATRLYDSAGVLTSNVNHTADGATYTTLYSAGVKTKMYVANADGTHDAYAYNITGKSYTTELQHADAAGKVIAVTRSHADGSIDYTRVIKDDGTKITTLYDSTGHKTTAITVNPSATITDRYDTSGRLTKEIVQHADGSVTTMVYTASVLTALYIVNADGSAATRLYDPAGVLTSDVNHNTDGSIYTTLHSAGVKTKMYVDKVDGTHDTWSYNIQGKSYTTELQHADATGKVIAVTRTHADGSLDYTQVIKSDGGKVTDTYDASGHKMSEVVLNADGSNTTDLFHSSGALTQTIAKTADGDTTTTNYSSGVKTSVYLVNADGSAESQLYDSSGHLTNDTVQHTDGSSSTTLYSAGVKTKMYVNNADGTHDNYAYNIAGQTYTTQHQHIDAAGKIDAVTRTHADGTLDYTQAIQSDGTRITGLYDSAGSQTQEIIQSPSGAKEVYKFTVAGSPGAVQHESYDTQGNLTLVDLQNSGGTHKITAVSTGLTISGGNGDDLFASAGSTTIAYDHGNDQINNFRAGSATNHDTIQIAQSLVSDYSHLQIEQSGFDALIHISANDTILLKNTYVHHLDQGNFLFA